MQINKFVINNVVVTYLDLEKELDNILNHDFASSNAESPFIDYNIGSLLFLSNLKNNEDELTFDLRDFCSVENMISYIRKEKNKYYYCSNITSSDKKSKKPYLSVNSKTNEKVYSSSIDIKTKYIEKIFNLYIEKSIQNNSFVIIGKSSEDKKYNNFGVLIELIASSDDSFYKVLKKEEKANVIKALNDKIKLDSFYNYKIDSINSFDVSYKCICSKQKCIEVAKSLINTGAKFDFEKEIKLHCPICGKEYIITKKDLV